jgi:hypothetical protein
MSGRHEKQKVVRLLAYVTGSVNQELLLQNDYLAAENRVLRGKLPSRLRLSNPERTTHSPRSGSVWDAEHFKKSPVLPSWTPSWPGIGG